MKKQLTINHYFPPFFKGGLWGVLFFLLTTHILPQSIFPGTDSTALADSIRLHYTPSNYLSYTQAQDTLYFNVFRKNDSISCFYSYYTLDLPAGVDPSTYLYKSGSSLGINCEHSYPQSKFNYYNQPKSDMHHLYPVKNNVNSSRSNNPYAEINDTHTDVWYYKNSVLYSIPTSEIEYYSEKDNDVPRFEPPEHHKGDIARALFYFYTIYQPLADEADPSFFAAMYTTLKSWHHLDPADSNELKRDSIIATIQGNYNPYILDSTLVDRVAFTQSTTQKISNLIITEIMFNPKVVTDTYGEWFEVYNNTDTTYNLLNMIIKDKDSDFHKISTNVYLLPRSYFVFGRNADTLINGNVKLDYQYSSFQIANIEDEIILTNSDGSVIDSIYYNSSWTIPDGKSLYFTGDTLDDNNNKSFWSVSDSLWPGSKGDFGSPGFGPWNYTIPDTTEDTLTYIKTIYETLKSDISFEIYPTQFNPNINITFTLNTHSSVELLVYNLLGELVSTIYSGYLSPGNYKHHWTTDSTTASGLYFITLNINNLSFTKKCLYLK